MSTKKIGNIGEEIIEAWFKKKGLIFYRAPDDRAHPIDWILASKDKKHLYLADAKTKARRAKYPDTGFQTDHYRQYLYLQNKYNIDVFIFFIDRILKEIYGGTLGNLSKPAVVNGKPYPWNLGEQIVFPLNNMDKIADISDEQAEVINTLSRQNEKLYENFNPELEEITVQDGFSFEFPPLEIKPRKKYPYDNPRILRQVLLDHYCMCGQNRHGPTLHTDYCEYKKILLSLKG